MGCQWSERGESFREISLNIRKEEVCGFLALLSILDIAQLLFCRANVLSKD